MAEHQFRLRSFVYATIIAAMAFLVSFPSLAQELFVAYGAVNGGVVNQFTPSGIFQGGFASASDSGMTDPWGIQFGPNGDLYATSRDAGGGTIKRFNGTSGRFVANAAIGLSTPLDVTFDSSGNLYVTEFGLNRVSKIDPATGLAGQTYGGLNQPVGLRALPNGNLLVANFGDNDVVEIDVATGGISVFATNVPGALGIALGLDGRCYVACNTSNDVRVVGPQGGVASIWSSGAVANQTGFIAFANGDLYATVLGGVNQYDGTTGAFKNSFAGAANTTGIAVRPAQPHLLVGTANGNVYEVTQAGWIIRNLIPAGTGGLGLPAGITFGPDGNVYVSDGVSTKTFDAVSGAFLGEIQTGAGGRILFGDDGTVYTEDSIGGAVFRVDPVTGSVLNTYTGPLSHPAGLAFLSHRQILVTNPLGAYGGTLAKIDTDTGAVSTFASGLGEAWAIAKGPDGRYYIANGASDHGPYNSVQAVDSNGNVSLFSTDVGVGPNDLTFAGANLFVVSYYDGKVSNIDGASGAIVGSFGVDGMALSIAAFPAQTTIVDTTPPSTTAEQLPVPNANGWNNSAVTVNLSSTDNDGGSGVKQILYSLDGGAVQMVAGSVQSIAIAGEGFHTLVYHAEDIEGNVEDDQTLLIQIDSTPPTANPQTITVDQDASVSITLTSSDSLSGVATIAVATGPTNGVLTGTSPNLTYTPTAGYNGSDSFTLQVTDNAGNTATDTVSITVNPALTGLTLNPASVTGGQPSVGTVTLSGPASNSGTVVALSSSANASVPPTVTVPSGQSSATFLIGTQVVSSNGNATITAVLGTVSKAAVLAIKTAVPLSVTLSPASVIGGQATIGTVNLTGSAPTGGLLVTLTSANTAATVQPSVTVPAGQATASFAISTVDVAANTVGAIRAKANGTTKSATLTVTPLLKSVTVSPASVVGGATSTGTVTLNGPAPAGGVDVTLTSSDPAATPPTSVHVAEAATSGTFTIATSPVSSSIAATISALSGSTTKTATLTIKPAVLSSIAINPNRVIGGMASVGTVTLNGAAPDGGTVVALASDNRAANVPSSITVAAGSTTANFPIGTSPVAVNTVCAISATLGAVTKSANLTVKAPALLSLTLDPTTVQGGVQNSIATVTLTGPAPAGGVAVTLESGNASVTSVPVSVLVPEGSNVGTATVTTSTVTKNTNVSISAIAGAVRKSASLKVTP